MRQPEQRSQQSGFTLVELVVVTSVLTILATIAVPNLLRGRLNANESATAQTLSTISKAQMQLRALGIIDSNGDGASEYGTLGEAAGTAIVRGTTEKIGTRMLSSSMGTVDANGRLSKHGYLFALYLPDSTGLGVPEVAAQLGNIDPGLAVNYFTCLAWPARKTASGNTSFFVNQQGQILKCVKATYSGTANVPGAGAALVSTDPNKIDIDDLAVGKVGADGNTWVPLN